jgi:thiosulfate reductase cytochrome b subunit
MQNRAMDHSAAAPSPAAAEIQYRHPLPLRLTHWINAIALTILLMSGLSIFNAHPALYWGKSSYTGRPPLLEMPAMQRPDGQWVGITRVLGRDFDTTGLFGVSNDRNGEPTPRGFPWWATIPDNQWLAMARAWHLFFAWVLVLNGLVYLGYALASGHVARNLVPTRRDWRGLPASFLDHLRLRHPAGEAAKRYNVLQRLAYLFVVFVLLPFIVVMGLGMSPWANAVAPGWVDVVGGRESARTLHFVAAWTLVAFVLVHVFQVVVTGLWNNLRSMITGRYRVPGEARHE